MAYVSREALDDHVLEYITQVRQKTGLKIASVFWPFPLNLQEKLELNLDAWRRVRKMLQLVCQPHQLLQLLHRYSAFFPLESFCIPLSLLLKYCSNRTRFYQIL